MKRIYFLFGFLMLLSCKKDSTKSAISTQVPATTIVSKSQNNSLKTIPQIKTIDDIKIEYSYISATAESGILNSTSFDYNCNEEKKGKLTYFYENNKLRFIKHTYNEYSHFSATDEYFIKDGKLFFVFLNHLGWSFTDQNQTKDDITEKRIYILDNQAVKCLQKKFTIYSDDKRSDGSNALPYKEIG